MFDLAELFKAYLVPFVIAVAVGLLAIFLTTRRGGETEIEDIRDAHEPPARRTFDPPAVEAPPVAPVPVFVPAPTSYTPAPKVVRSTAADIDISIGDTTQFELPLRETATVPLTGDSHYSPLHGDASPRSILVVDDSVVPRAKLRKLFETQGYEVHTANDGVDALELLAKRKFSVIITDLEMPNMDGFELIAAIQGSLETEDIPVIAITGHEDMQARVTDIRGLYGIFKKPWNDRELLKRVAVLAHIGQS